MKDRLPIVVLRSNDVCFLGIVRSCAAAGVEAIAVTFTWPGAGPWHSESSRHIGETHAIPNPFEFPEEAGEAMAELGRKLFERFGERLLVLGSSDTNLMFLRDNADTLLPYFRFMGDREMDRGRFDLLHKARCAELLEGAGVATPLTRGCSRPEDVEAVVRDMVFPCVYKPAVKDYGQTFYASHGGAKAIAVDSPEVLRRELHREIERGFDLVVQEKVTFDAVTDEIPFYSYADGGGRVRLAATAIKETIQPHPYGTATVLRLSHHPQLLPTAAAVIEAIGYRGILMIELIRDAADGRWKVIELNPRPWLFVDFFRRSGLNYLRYLVEDRDQAMESWPELLTPQTAGPAPVHISLPVACGAHLAKLGRTATIADVVAWLRGIEGPRTLTFLDPGDPAPGESELSAFATTWNLDAAALLAAVRSEVSDA